MIPSFSLRCLLFSHVSRFSSVSPAFGVGHCSGLFPRVLFLTGSCRPSFRCLDGLKLPSHLVVFRERSMPAHSHPQGTLPEGFESKANVIADLFPRTLMSGFSRCTKALELVRVQRTGAWLGGSRIADGIEFGWPTKCVPTLEHRWQPKPALSMRHRIAYAQRPKHNQSALC